MTAALYGEVVTAAPDRYLQVVRSDGATVPSAARPAANEKRPFILINEISDPLVDGVARLLSVPVRHAYAALLRAGVLEIRA